MQDSDRVGRVLLESLHQAVDEVLPARVEFYERWLKPDATQNVSAASFAAMLSVLHQEGAASHVIFDFAGQYAAVRSFNGLLALRRAFMRMLPRRLRARMATRLLIRVLARLHGETRIDMSRRRSTVFINVEGSPFCAAAPPAEPPTCRFYSTFILTFLQLFHLRAAVRVTRCRASGVPSCLFMVLADQPRQIGDIESSALDPGDEFAVLAVDVTLDVSQPVQDLRDAPPPAPAMPAPELEAPAPVQEVAGSVPVETVAEVQTADSTAIEAPVPEVAHTVEPDHIVEDEIPEIATLWDAVQKRTSRPVDGQHIIEQLFSRSPDRRDAETPWHEL